MWSAEIAFAAFRAFASFVEFCDSRLTGSAARKCLLNGFRENRVRFKLVVIFRRQFNSHRVKVNLSDGDVTVTYARSRYRGSLDVG